MRGLKTIGSIGLAAAFISAAVLSFTERASADMDPPRVAVDTSTDIATQAYDRAERDLVGAVSNLEPPICFETNGERLIVVPTPDYGMRVAALTPIADGAVVSGGTGVHSANGLPVVDLAPSSDPGIHSYVLKTPDTEVAFNLTVERRNVAFELVDPPDSAWDVKQDPTSRSGLACSPFA